MPLLTGSRIFQGSMGSITLSLPMCSIKRLFPLMKAEQELYIGHLLVVDDESLTVESLAKHSMYEGFHASKATNGNDAIELIKNNKYAVVITDMCMPGCDGFKVLQAVLKYQPLCQVIFLTGHGTINSAVKAMQEGAFDYVTKPLNLDKLLVTVKNAISTYEGKALIASTESMLMEWWNYCKKSRDPAKRGNALEVVCQLLFSSIPGFTVIGRRIRSSAEELDLLLRNESIEPFWLHFGTYILFECKAWKKRKPGRDELDAIMRKMERRGQKCDLAFFVSFNGVASTVIKETRSSIREGKHIVILDKNDIENLISSSGRSELLKKLVENTIL
jgi:DNA-binding response OmpR family regulator